jgi:type IV secretion system protein VirB9
LQALSTVTSPIRVVRWTVPAATEDVPTLESPGLLPSAALPRAYHVGYSIEADGAPPDWQPRSVIDDGKKLYIIYPERTLFATVPLIRLVGANGPQLVNTRQYLNVVIVDQIPGRLELRVGAGDRAEVVRITRGTLQTIACPGTAGCPVWPEAATTLSRRSQP